MPDLSLVMPFFNEEKILASVVTRTLNVLRDGGINFELVCVNNGSRDGTAQMLSDLRKDNSEIKVVTVDDNQGYGFGIISGLQAAAGKYIGYSDGDGQVMAEDVIRVFKTMREKKLDICKGTRVIRGDGLQRIITSYAYNLVLNMIFLAGFKDINAKPKIMRRECFEKMNLQSKDWFIDSEILIKARALNYSTGAVQVRFDKRSAGKSNVRVSVIFEFLRNIMRARLGWR